MLYRFRNFDLDTERRELRRNGVVVPIAHKAQMVLHHLVENRDRMVTKSELLDQFWSKDISEAALQTTISVIRKALGPDGRSIVKTYHGRGVRFVPDVVVLSEPQGFSEAPAAPARERRVVTVLSARLKRTDQDDGTVRAFLATARALVAAEHGQPLRMLFDGFTAVFGLGPQSDDSARRAATCAWRLLNEGIRDGEDRLGSSIGFGLSSGRIELNCGDGADNWSPPETVERNAAMLAAKAQDGQILIDTGVRFQLGDDARVQVLDAGYALLSSPAARAGTPSRWRDRGRPFVGRTAELALLNASLSNMQAGNGRTVVLSGPAGIGKTRLVREFLSKMEPDGVGRVIVNCLPRLSDTPSAAIRQLCVALQKQGPNDAVDDAIDAALLSQLIDVNVRPGRILEVLSDHMKKMRSRALVARLVASASAAKPLILVIEDIHWIDKTSRSYLEHLMQKADRQRTLFVLTTRPLDDPPLTEGELKLSPLTASDSKTILEQIAEEGSLSEEHARTLIDRAGGNPFFLEELALMVMDGDDPATAMPETVQAVIEVRVSALAPALRAVLYAVAVIGPPAPEMLVAQLLGSSTDAMAKDLDRLVRLGFLKEDPDGFAFRHMLLQGAAYEMIVPADRRRLHRKTAELLQTSSDPVRPEVLAWHLEEAGDRVRAIEFWKKASNAALSRSAGQAAITFARRGLTLIDAEDLQSSGDELGLQLSLATALMTQRGYAAEEVGQAYRRAHHLCGSTGSTRARWRTLLGLWVHTWVAGRLQESLSYGRELLDFAKLSNDPALTMQAHGSLGAVLMHAGASEAARTHLEAGAAMVSAEPPDTITEQNAAVNCLAYAGWVCALQGRRDEMTSFLHLSEARCQAIENPFATAIHLALFSDAFMCAGDIGTTEDYAVRAAKLSREQNFPFWLGTGLVMQGWVIGQRGDFDSAFQAIDEGLRIFAATGARVQMANWHGVRAETCLAAERPAEGLVALRAALECAERTGDIWFLPRIHSVAAGLYQLIGDPALSEQHRRLAADLARDHHLAPVFVRSPGVVR